MTERVETRVRGWLLLLCVLLLVWQPISLSLTIAGRLDSLSLRGLCFAAILAARFLAAALGIAAGLSLMQRRPGAVSLARASLIVSAAIDVLIYATPWYPNNRPPGDAPLILIGTLMYYALWLGYLSRSKRVASTFDR
jgi:hypothetical protein